MVCHSHLRPDRILTVCENPSQTSPLKVTKEFLDNDGTIDLSLKEHQRFGILGSQLLRRI